MDLLSKAKDGAKSTALDSLKEVWKKTRAWLGGLLLFYGLSLVEAFYKLDHTPTNSEAARLLWQSFKSLPWFFKEWVVTPLYDLMIENPAQSTALGILLSGYAVLIVMLVKSDRRLSRHKELVADAPFNEALVKQAGLKARYPHAKQGEGGASWKALCDDIMLPENKFLFILGANGVDTFGGPDSPLFDTLDKFHGTVRVILCEPDSKPMVGRAKAVKVTPQDYKRAIRTSQRRLKELREQQHAVEARFYQGEPNWKLIITSTTVWVQYYFPGGPHVDETPVWHLAMAPNSEGFYHLFYMEFNRVWERCKATPMKLN